MSVTAIIVAAGRGVRAGGAVPKQWQPLAGARVIDHTLAAFLQNPQVTQVIAVLHGQDMVQAPALETRGITVVVGGADRRASVQAGLRAAAGAEHVLIHDAARPCISHALISDVIAALKDAPAAAPGLPVTDALWRGAHGAVEGSQDREGLFAAQTPQGFELNAIQAAHDAYQGPAADDVAVARAAGMAVVIVPGSADNLKITSPADFARAARILERQMDIRTGSGFDVHAFGPGDHVMLCGVKIPHDQGLVGHSDADVGLHTLSDAIYGALAMGDIGQHFPPSDPQWKGIESHVFLRHAGQLAVQHGFTLTHLDCTLICEHPKIGPHAAEMRAAVAEMLGLDLTRVSVKATTTERLGFAGRGEGIACMATATLVKT
ncbi:bifunctional 2-C-methyl-D-erythritol 4-phosphate cytidylyltransferase/2-C-methyl-D-erythritol 2,4-cyclodiphosphate synthase [Sulfitobacter sp. SK012]|uniref:bifunctional 2-C-methyl-D-erythritol 4-phosphate cytidylyltransferase/2-C-methyl-D-erythritol 2,4-cyclodiphosphate synthase n=1 Tax=Sulfitobacter sp. SK012 TaxID=1389005 RepID=UPI000E0CBC34|nr:bifunctional 2-C-methyl-D-erythritol 4-phosphate cytidylyltransferase/2-C-methyl-D-erythritol 2,4-cyclodiphosphate synthase [Sulfitobacter sp. SK012]AXI46796.1 bifunctional 2-C-methyl-D-erythritol 4-phosphate cytidylyltransferase/2-C-methyl-D-erythritol 2,4-cyclodiphosphate synthase [Sulfitobacter sp. SK012]